MVLFSSAAGQSDRAADPNENQISMPITFPKLFAVNPDKFACTKISRKMTALKDYTEAFELNLPRGSLRTMIWSLSAAV